MSSFIVRRRARAFTLLEVLLALGLAVILALASVPAMGGWIAEHRLRMKADELVRMVQSAKLEAENTARAQVVVLLPENKKPPTNAPANIHFLQCEGGTEWTIVPFGWKGKGRPDISEIHVDSHGLVDPVTVRVAEGDRYVEYRFDFLTGHAREEGSSF